MKVIVNSGTHYKKRGELIHCDEEDNCIVKLDDNKKLAIDREFLSVCGDFKDGDFVFVKKFNRIYWLLNVDLVSRTLGIVWRTKIDFDNTSRVFEEDFQKVEFKAGDPIIVKEGNLLGTISEYIGDGIFGVWLGNQKNFYYWYQFVPLSVNNQILLEEAKQINWEKHEYR
jgi:hypothetical protein